MTKLSENSTSTTLGAEATRIKDTAINRRRKGGGASGAERKIIAAKLSRAKPGDILLFHHAVGLNRLITWLTRSCYYHVGIYQGNNHVVESRPRGVVSRDLYGPDGDRYFDVIPAPAEGAAALAWAESKLGSGYDQTDAIAITLDQLFRLRCPGLSRWEQGQYSCGEFVDLAFCEAGVTLFPNKESAVVVPADFGKLKRGGKKSCGTD